MKYNLWSNLHDGGSKWILYFIGGEIKIRYTSMLILAYHYISKHHLKFDTQMTQKDRRLNGMFSAFAVIVFSERMKAFLC